MFTPYVIEQTAKGEQQYDIFSRLLKDRVIMLAGEINDVTASLIVAQLLFLESQDDKRDIYIYINSPGGSVTAGMSIYDTMNFIKPDIVTICIGQAASMGSFLLSAGTQGKRYSLPNSTIMIHQPLGGASGQATDIQIKANEIQRLKNNLNNLLAKHTGQDVLVVEKDTDRDNFMSANEACEYGLIDKVIDNRNEV